MLIMKWPGAEDLELPRYQTAEAAGMDLRANVQGDVYIPPQDWRVVPCGVAIALPMGFHADIRSRSGLVAKHGVEVLGCPGTVDSDYRGELKATLYNHGKHEPFVVRRGDRIAQLVICKHEHVRLDLVEALPASERGVGGHGSTGVK